MHEDVLGDELGQLGDVPRLEDPEIAADDLGIACADGFGWARHEPTAACSHGGTTDIGRFDACCCRGPM
ncbi:hypothetical protein [Lentzea atacamensis]|uniref:hypothetical protein n=1 Tax=Lentzea atacamensis TaxID=531938 RepID=UPI001475C094|nr:hypothetical protein [Lentzea atacamensis]